MCYHSYFFVLDSPCFSNVLFERCISDVMLPASSCTQGCTLYVGNLAAKDDSTIDAFFQRPAKGRLIIQVFDNKTPNTNWESWWFRMFFLVIQFFLGDFWSQKSSKSKRLPGAALVVDCAQSGLDW